MTSRTRAVFIAASMAFFLGAGFRAGADQLVMRDGRREQCVVLAEGDGWVRVRRGGGVVTVPRSAVAAIEKESAADNAVLSAEYALASESLLATLDRYVAARDQGASGQNLCRSLTRLVERASTEANALTPEIRAKLHPLLSSLVGPASDSAPADFLCYSAGLLIRFGSMGDAMKLYDKIPPEYFARYPQRRTALADWVVADVKRLLDEGDSETALERMEALQTLDASRGKSCEAIVQLSRARQMRAASQYGEALKVYAGKVARDFPAIARDRSRITLEEAAAKARETGAFQDVIDLIDGTGQAVLGQDGLQKMLAQAYRDWGLWRLDHGDYEGARLAFREFQSRSPEAKLTFTNLVEYRERRSQIVGDSPEQHYELGKFCVDAEMFDEAAAEFRLAQSDPNWSQLARMQIAQLDKKRYEGMLLEALEASKSGHAEEAREKAAFVLQHAQDPEIRQDAERVAGLAAKAVAEVQLRAPKEAEVLLQNAQRCVLPAEADTCLALLEQVVRQYPQTPAAERAATLRRTLLSHGLARFEGQSRDMRVPDLKGRSAQGAPLAESEKPQDSRGLSEETRQIQKALETPAAP